MGCGGSCGTKSGGTATAGCGSTGGCSTGGCNKLNVYDWLSDMASPPGMRPFDIVEVAFKGSRKGYYRNVHNLDLYKGDEVAVEVETGGFDIGRVSVKGELVKLQLKKNGYNDEDDRIKKLYRKATEADLAKWQECKEQEIPTQYKARSIAMELGLQMKLSDVEYQADKRKAVFFYTAEARVDFRELIKRLAETFKVKIEMRQISYREEAGRLGSIGSCGRVLCCSTWLTDFKQVNTSAARYQNLSLNPLKLSGQCGRLKCCLNYELDTYLEAIHEFPKSDNLRIELEHGTALLQKTDILRRLMWFSVIGSDSNNWICLPVPKVNELIEMNKRGEKPAQLSAYVEQVEVSAEEEFDFKDMVGEDSITRLDQPKKKRPANKGRGGQNNRNQPNRPRGEERSAAAPGEKREASNRPPRDPNRKPDPNRQPRDPNRKPDPNREHPNRTNNPDTRSANPNPNPNPNPNNNPNRNRNNRNRGRGGNNPNSNKGPSNAPPPPSNP